MESIGKEDVGSTIADQVFKAPFIHQTKRLRRSSKAILAMIRKPLESPFAGDKHALVGESSANDKLGTSLKIPHFPSDTVADARPVRTRNCSVLAVRKFITQVVAVRRIVVLELVKLVHLFSGAIVVVLEDLARLDKILIFRGGIVCHIEIRERSSRHLNGWSE